MKTTSKAVFWIIVVFVTGVLFGGALTFVVFQPEQPPWGDHKPSGKKSPDSFLNAISEMLELDQDQHEQFRTLLIESRDQFRMARREIHQNTRARLRSILRPDQLEKFDEFVSKAPRHHPLGREEKPE